MRVLFFKCLLLLFAWVGPAVAAPSPVILVLGDSLSSAHGLPLESGWVSLLERRLAEDRLNYKVVNASLTGETTLGGRQRIAALLKSHAPALLIVELGGNDGLRGLDPAETRANLAAIVDACRAARAQVLLVGMQLPPNYGPSYTEKFQQVFRDVAREKRVPLVPFLLEGFGTRRDLFQPDGIHPSAAAQPLMLDNVWPRLRPLLAPRKAVSAP